MGILRIEDILTVDRDKIDLPADCDNVEKTLIQLTEAFHLGLRKPITIEGRPVQMYTGYRVGNVAYLLGIGINGLKVRVGDNEIAVADISRATIVPGYEIIRFGLRRNFMRKLSPKTFMNIFAITERYMAYLADKGVVQADNVGISSLPLFDYVFPKYGSPRFREIAPHIGFHDIVVCNQKYNRKLREILR